MTSTQQRHLTVAGSPHKISGDAKNALSGYSERMLLCRENQHRWPDMDQWHWSELRGWRRRVIHYRREMTCERCGMVAVDIIDAVTGTKEPRSYRQPEGYRLSADLEIERADLRLEMVRRFVKDKPLPEAQPRAKDSTSSEESSSDGRKAQ